MAGNINQNTIFNLLSRRIQKTGQKISCNNKRTQSALVSKEPEPNPAEGSTQVLRQLDRVLWGGSWKETFYEVVKHPDKAASEVTDKTNAQNQANPFQEAPRPTVPAQGRWLLRPHSSQVTSSSRTSSWYGAGLAGRAGPSPRRALPLSASRRLKPHDPERLFQLKRFYDSILNIKHNDEENRKYSSKNRVFFKLMCLPWLITSWKEYLMTSVYFS